MSKTYRKFHEYERSDRLSGGGQKKEKYTNYGQYVDDEQAGDDLTAWVIEQDMLYDVHDFGEYNEQN